MSEEDKLKHGARLAKAIVDAGVPDEVASFELVLQWDEGLDVTVKAGREGGELWRTIH